MQLSSLVGLSILCFLIGKLILALILFLDSILSQEKTDKCNYQLFNLGKLIVFLQLNNTCMKKNDQKMRQTTSLDDPHPHLQDMRYFLESPRVEDASRNEGEEFPTPTALNINDAESRVSNMDYFLNSPLF